MKKNSPAILTSLQKRKAMLLSKNNSSKKKENGKKKGRFFLRKETVGNQQLAISKGPACNQQPTTSNEQHAFK
jgi:hypothetical protein